MIRSQLVKMINSSPYSLGTDGSIDEGGLKKLKPILIRLFDSHKGKVWSQLLDMSGCKEATGDALFRNINACYYKIRLRGIAV